MENGFKIFIRVGYYLTLAIIFYHALVGYYGSMFENISFLIILYSIDQHLS